MVVAFSVVTAVAVAQQHENPPVVRDEIVVQVNNEVITRSQVLRESHELGATLTKQRGMTTEQARGEVEKRQPEIILNLINEALLVQRANELEMSGDIDAEVNREVLRIGRQVNLRTPEELEEAMRRDGLDLADVKKAMHRSFMREAVLRREVDAKIYYGLTDKQLRDYYNAHRDRFVSVTLSELFLGLAGRSENEVRASAADLARHARASTTSFEELVEKNSEREATRKTRGVLSDGDGKPRWFLVSELRPDIAAGVKDLKAGGVADPIKGDDGYVVLRINQRDDSFRDNLVRGVMTSERADKARSEYLKQLRDDAHLAVAEPWRAVLEPYLMKR